MIKKAAYLIILIHLALIGLSAFINYRIESYKLVHLTEVTKDNKLFKYDDTYYHITKTSKQGIDLYNTLGKYNWIDKLCWDNQSCINTLAHFQLKSLPDIYSYRRNSILDEMSTIFDTLAAEFEQEIQITNDLALKYQIQFKERINKKIIAFDKEFEAVENDLILNMNRITPYTKENTIVMRYDSNLKSQIDSKANFFIPYGRHLEKK
jgi:hypothetical protein